MVATRRVEDIDRRADAQLGPDRARGTELALTVIDANVALHLASADLFGRVTDDLVAPALMWSEVAASVRRAVATGRASRGVGQATLDRVLAAHIHRRAGDELYRRAVDLAGELGWSKSHDAEYLALAQIERMPVATLDARLRTAAERLVGVVDVRDILR